MRGEFALVREFTAVEHTRGVFARAAALTFRAGAWLRGVANFPHLTVLAEVLRRGNWYAEKVTVLAAHVSIAGA